MTSWLLCLILVLSHTHQTDVRLESLAVNELVLVPPFHPELLQYEVVLPFSQSTVQLLPRAMAGENVEILVDGEDPITVFTTPVGTTECTSLPSACPPPRFNLKPTRCPKMQLASWLHVEA